MPQGKWDDYEKENRMTWADHPKAWGTKKRLICSVKGHDWNLIHDVYWDSTYLDGFLVTTESIDKICKRCGRWEYAWGYGTSGHISKEEFIKRLESPQKG